jgi:hypothetical protein
MNDGAPTHEARSAMAAGAMDDEATGYRSNFAWLLPWVLASIGFLMTLALLR